MKKLSKLFSFNRESLKSIAPVATGIIMGSAAVGLVTSNFMDLQKMAVEVPAAEEFELTPAQMQEVATILRSLRDLAEDNLDKNLAGINAEIALKLSHTLGETIDAVSSRELLTIIDSALADLDATLTRQNDNGIER